MPQTRRSARSWTRLCAFALAAGLAAPASAHLLSRGIPLSELAVTSPAAVTARVTAAPKDAVELEVEAPVIGRVPAGPLRVALEGHHPPAYAVGARVLVFLTTGAPPFASRQTALDLVALPGAATERDALLATVRAYAGLRGIADAGARRLRLKMLGLRNLDSPSERVRREALLDLVALATGGVRFAAADVARVAALAKSGETPATFAPGLVVLLATVRTPDTDAALVALLEGSASPKVRARAARVIGKRRAANAVALLRAALADPALEVRLTAQRALEEIDTSAARAALKQDAAVPSSSNDTTGRES